MQTIVTPRSLSDSVLTIVSNNDFDIEKFRLPMVRFVNTDGTELLMGSLLNTHEFKFAPPTSDADYKKIVTHTRNVIRDGRRGIDIHIYVDGVVAYIINNTNNISWFTDLAGGFIYSYNTEPKPGLYKKRHKILEPRVKNPAAKTQEEIEEEKKLNEPIFIDTEYAVIKIDSYITIGIDVKKKHLTTTIINSVTRKSIMMSSPTVTNLFMCGKILNIQTLHSCLPQPPIIFTDVPIEE